MVARVSKSQFKAKALELFREIEATGEPLIVTDHGQPKLEIRRIAQKHHNPLDMLKGSVLRYDDPFEPVGEGDWEVLK
ncbi:antitoxin (DNA-binding transcriptional repressor) of toxin-antitoxin stability system [Aminobacter lissarensis]|uniref:Antitoxin (DNA-binding transcriptional repressor) of toxin-antitoxin stability system n=1 Tax=Aminobacter carboxidus TaxID=376165 RepID=A0A8E1WMJ4_9HYPH|nr:type II toxin-antitoxin system Phd/YefM family antitoxin [Aminobacter lissarensis]MBB6470351.1 antitoxin (DNA-binding transcriptional repressor) of toxin-antitoxin stability system [Aminobacter lissarensis]